jgi:NIPSNAP
MLNLLKVINALNRTTRSVAASVAIFVAGILVGTLWRPDDEVRAQSPARVFELRKYTTPEGKLPNLQARFRDHTMRIFEKHGMTSIGYWTPQDTPASANTLIYIIAHPDRETAAKNWQAFRDDPEWQKVSQESQVDGPIVSNVESTFMDATDYSPLK